MDQRTKHKLEEELLYRVTRAINEPIDDVDWFIENFLKDVVSIVEEGNESKNAKIPFGELKEAALPLIKFLKDYYHPNAQIIITWDNVKVTEDLLSIPIPD